MPRMSSDLATGDDALQTDRDHTGRNHQADPCRLSLPRRAVSRTPTTYRSVEADALALPGFTFGLDIVLLVGQLRLSQHQTVDEVHQELLGRLEPLGVSIARR